MTAEKLYHFTSLEAALSILQSQSLRFGVRTNSNDVLESSPNIWIRNDKLSNYFVGKNYVSQIYDILSCYKTLCFCQDTPHSTPGYALHNMWGYYADKGEGVCLAFDKAKLLTVAKAMDAQISQIKYSRKYNGDIIINNKNLEQCISKQHNSIFFQKRYEWKPERELRVLIKASSKNEVVNLPISDCILAVIVCNLRDLWPKEAHYESPTFKSLTDSFAKPLGIPVLAYSVRLGTDDLINYTLQGGEHWDMYHNIKSINLDT